MSMYALAQESGPQGPRIFICASSHFTVRAFLQCEYVREMKVKRETAVDILYLYKPQSLLNCCTHWLYT